MIRADLLRLAVCARRFLSCSSLSKSSACVSMNNATNMGCMVSSSSSRVLRRDGQQDAGRAVRRNHAAARKDLAHVVEHDHSVAQQAPSLLGVAGDSAGRVAVTVVGRGAWRLV